MNNLTTVKLFRARKFMMYANNWAWRGHFHRPSIPLYQPYIHKRRHRLEDVGRTIFHDIAPEHFVGIYSAEYQTTYSVIFRFIGTFFLTCPVIIFLMYVCKVSFAQPVPVVKDVPDHAHMVPGLIAYLKRQNFREQSDFIGRNNGTFYRRLFQEEFDKPGTTLKRLKNHGIKI